MDSKSQRRSERRKIRVPILCWEADNEKRLGRGKELACKDLSADGIGFHSESIYPIGTVLYLDIYLPGQASPISCKINIVRVEALVNKEEYLTGAIFMDMALDEKSLITTAIGKMNLYQLLKSVLEGGASDLHLTVGRPPMVRRHGRILPMAEEVIDDGQVEAMLYPLLTQNQIEFFEQNKEMDFAFSPNLISRFRVNMHWQKGFAEAALRNIPTDVKSFEELGLPVDKIQNFCEKKAGLILIAGTTGSGKTTTMSSMVNYLNTTKEYVVITIEDPIEYTFKSQKSIVKQRELKSDTLTYAEALKRVLRQDPDVICVGELLDGECLMSAMRAAETGHLVISTIHAPSTVQAIERVINFFPPEHSSNIAQQLSSCLIGILYQVLVPRRKGGRALATELMINNNAMKNLIREGKYSYMGNVLQTGRALGMYPLKHSLTELYKKGEIDDMVTAEFMNKEC